MSIKLSLFELACLHEQKYCDSMDIAKKVIDKAKADDLRKKADELAATVVEERFTYF